MKRILPLLLLLASIPYLNAAIVQEYPSIYGMLVVRGPEPPLETGEELNISFFFQKNGKPIDHALKLTVMKNGDVLFSSFIQPKRGVSTLSFTPVEPGTYEFRVEPYVEGKRALDATYSITVSATPLEQLKIIFTVSAFILVLLLGTLSFLGFRDGLYKMLWVLLITISLFLATFSFL